MPAHLDRYYLPHLPAGQAIDEQLSVLELRPADLDYNCSHMRNTFDHVAMPTPDDRVTHYRLLTSDGAPSQKSRKQLTLPESFNPATEQNLSYGFRKRVGLPIVLLHAALMSAPYLLNYCNCK